MAVPGIQDVDALVGELALLEHRERELSAERARLHERMAVGSPEPADRGERQSTADRLSLYRRIERQLSEERRALHERIEVLRSELAVRRGERAR